MPTHQHHPLQAIAFMLTGMACFSTMNIVIRMVSADMHFTQMVFLRNVFALAAIVAWCAIKTRGRPTFATSRLKSHFWRASIGVVSMEMWFYSITTMPVTLATAISFITPIFSTLFAMLFLGEKTGPRRMAAIGTGFIGMLIILRPDHAGLVHAGVWVVLASALLMAVVGVMVKSLTRTETPETIVFYMALFMVPWSLPPALMHWESVSLHALGLVVLVAVVSTAAHLLLTRAMQKADMAVLMPFDFTRLVFTAALAYVFFGETLDRYTVLGAAIITASSVYIAHREARLHRTKPMLLD